MRAHGVAHVHLRSEKKRIIRGHPPKFPPSTSEFPKIQQLFVLTEVVHSRKLWKQRCGKTLKAEGSVEPMTDDDSHITRDTASCLAMV